VPKTNAESSGQPSVPGGEPAGQVSWMLPSPVIWPINTVLPGIHEAHIRVPPTHPHPAMDDVPHNTPIVTTANTAHTFFSMVISFIPR
jgi:hypothetical protein